jgi:hypothetical protein
MAVTLKNAVFLDVAHFSASWDSLTVTSDVPRWRILPTMKMEATYSSESSVITRSTGPYILEDGILRSKSSLLFRVY